MSRLGIKQWSKIKIFRECLNKNISNNKKIQTYHWIFLIFTIDYSTSACSQGIAPLHSNFMCWLFIIHFCHCMFHGIIFSLPIIHHLSNQHSCPPRETPMIDKTSAVILTKPILITAISVFFSMVKYTKIKNCHYDDVSIHTHLKSTLRKNLAMHSRFFLYISSSLLADLFVHSLSHSFSHTHSHSFTSLLSYS